MTTKRTGPVYVYFIVLRIYNNSPGNRDLTWENVSFLEIGLLYIFWFDESEFLSSYT